MSIFSDNIRFLRHKKSLSQQSIAENIGISRVRYAKYEDGRSEPPFDVLLNISKYFSISIDLMLTLDVRKYSLEDTIKLPDNRIVLPIRVDHNGNDQIEVVPHKTSMGYLKGYGDPEYIESLDIISLPFLKGGKFRAFPADGDSMPPYKDGTYIVGKYVEDLSDLKTDRTYVFITSNDGISYKRFQFHEADGIWVKADNSFYEPYKILLPEIKEIWEFACSINTKEYEPDEFSERNMQNFIAEIKSDIRHIKERII
ncbi:XRE family transcriptional regulator [Chryseobacterium cheonjiense]|uniref:LexA family transcriptional regulator n=1 Tax=Chryseobacterium cheonjiense TaxID=2728845 RepID=A0A7Y0FI31_9FLAO|nr:LexA family transcriptional regulator [Chryseobacterium cheonjiense]NML56787.1 LexA family transcriptional regulator [Chryseobacterium cheonjiense]